MRCECNDGGLAAFEPIIVEPTQNKNITTTIEPPICATEDDGCVFVWDYDLKMLDSLPVDKKIFSIDQEGIFTTQTAKMSHAAQILYPVQAVVFNDRQVNFVSNFTTIIDVLAEIEGEPKYVVGYQEPKIDVKEVVELIEEAIVDKEVVQEEKDNPIGVFFANKLK